MLLSPLMCAGVEKHRTIRVTIKGGEWPNGCHGFFLSVGCRSISAICKRSCYCFMVYRSFPDTLALPGWSWDMVLVTVGVAPRYALYYASPFYLVPNGPLLDLSHLSSVSLAMCLFGVTVW